METDARFAGATGRRAPKETEAIRFAPGVGGKFGIWASLEPVAAETNTWNRRSSASNSEVVTNRVGGGSWAK